MRTREPKRQKRNRQDRIERTEWNYKRRQLKLQNQEDELEYKQKLQTEDIINAKKAIKICS